MFSNHILPFVIFKKKVSFFQIQCNFKVFLGNNSQKMSVWFEDSRCIPKFLGYTLVRVKVQRKPMKRPTCSYFQADTGILRARGTAKSKMKAFLTKVSNWNWLTGIAKRSILDNAGHLHQHLCSFKTFCYCNKIKLP